jgi:hypothetical protein
VAQKFEIKRILLHYGGCTVVDVLSFIIGISSIGEILREIEKIISNEYMDSNFC